MQCFGVVPSYISLILLIDAFRRLYKSGDSLIGYTISNKKVLWQISSLTIISILLTFLAFFFTGKKITSIYDYDEAGKVR